mgnify:CR=1 FL=1
MKRMVSLLLTLVLALLLAGCGGNAAAAADSAAAPRDNGSGYWNTTADTDSISEDQNMAYEAEEPGASAYNDSKAQSDRPAKKVYTGYMEMQTLDFDKASGDIDALVKELGGYFQQSSVSNRGNSGYRYGSYTIRIPSAQFDTFLQKAGTLCHLVYSSTGTDDVSETYYDTEARLETARIKLERLQALLAKATSMDDIITIESAISETEWDIENLSGTLRRYDALVDYATIDVELSEVYKLSGQDEAVTTFGGRLGQSFVNGLRAVGSALEDFAVWLAYSWVWLLVIAAVIVVIVRIVRRRGGGKKLSLKRKKAAAEDTEPKE